MSVIELPVVTVQGLSGGTAVSVVVSEPNTPHQTILDMPIALQEYTHDLPIGTRSFIVHPTVGVVTLSYGSGPQTHKVTISAGGNTEVSNISLTSILKLRLVGKKAAEKTEIEWWT